MAHNPVSAHFPATILAQQFFYLAIFFFLLSHLCFPAGRFFTKQPELCFYNVRQILSHAAGF